MTSAAANPEVTLLFRLRDEMSGQLAVVNQRLEQVERTGGRVNDSFRRNTNTTAGYSRTLLLFGATALSVASSVSRLAGQMGFLNEEQEKQLTTIISTIGALSALAGGLARLIPLIIAIARAERTRAIVAGVANVLSTPGGIIAVAAAIAAGALIGTYLNSVIASHQMGIGQRHTIPGPTTQGRLAMVHGGEVISRPSESGSAGTVNVNLTGPFMGSESEARSFARKIGRYLQEEKRIGGLTI